MTFSRITLGTASLGFVFLVSSLVFSGCSQTPPPKTPPVGDDTTQIQTVFHSCAQALRDHKASDAVDCFSSNLPAYFQKLNTPDTFTPDPASETPVMDQMLFTYLHTKVPPDLKSGLTLPILAQHVLDKQALKTDALKGADLGQVTINGNSASAPLLFNGQPVSRLPITFVKENGFWKIDVLAVLPYAEVMLQFERAFKSQTVDQQIEHHLSKVPSL